MKKILIPTDFSDNSLNAVDYALQLYEDEPCTFYILNTYMPAFYHIEYVINPSEYGLENPLQEESLTGLERLKERIINEQNNVNHYFETISSFNSLVSEIKKIIDTYAIDLIVMGTKGLTNAKKVLLGSNAIHVLKNASCPVLTIPSNFTYEAPKELLFPTDYKIDYEVNLLKPVLEIATKFNSRIHIIHVMLKEELSQVQKDKKAILAGYFKKPASLFHEIDNENIADAVKNYQLRAKINLLIMINNRHLFLEKLFFKDKINQIMLHLNIPFLVLPSN